ncbi:caffeic acid 3-O-methyltransferase-like isoform X4 [Quercus robur]|uniref:caffeic acid 3-O-methyltransferase-like isoform X4 n=1 Tax=Quercus robur TaxID=38942 RepID=UPI00216387B4|nr:caffeic acid 3-O-methyltransferase-like isoform X4 [Quercus robur]
MSSKESQIGAFTNGEDSLSQYAMQLATASVLPMVLKAAIELGVLEILDRAGPGALLSTSQIASQLPTHSNQDKSLLLDCMLKLLASHSILTCSIATPQHDGQVSRLYGLAPVSKYFIKEKDEFGGSLAPFLDLFQDKVTMNIWYHLKDAILEGGIPFSRAYGMEANEYARKDDKFREIFMGSMKDLNPLIMKKILEKYKGFEGLKLLVDVGGGDGTLLNMIISKYPTIKGVNFDLASVIEKLPSYPGIEHIVGDMFVSIPKGDAIFIKWVLHHWDEKQCLKVLKNCYEALPDQGKVIVVDMVIPEAPATTGDDKSLFQLYSFLMNTNPKRKERTEREFERLAKDAGFSGLLGENFQSPTHHSQAEYARRVIEKEISKSPTHPQTKTTEYSATKDVPPKLRLARIHKFIVKNGEAAKSKTLGELAEDLRAWGIGGIWSELAEAKGNKVVKKD